MIGKLDTLFKTDNGLENNDINYVEFDADAFQVNDIFFRATNQGISIYDWLMQKNRRCHNEVSILL